MPLAIRVEEAMVAATVERNMVRIEVTMYDCNAMHLAVERD